MGGRGGVVALLLAVGSVNGCVAPGRTSSGAMIDRWAPTLLIESATVDHVAVRVNGFRVGTITRGVNCISIPAMSGSLTVDFVSLGSRARTPERLRLSPGSHWRLEIGPAGRLPQDLRSFRSVPRGCEHDRPTGVLRP